MTGEQDRAVDPDHEAVDALKAGDLAGLETLMARYQRGAIRTAYRILGDAETAKDVVADAFLAVYEQIDRYDEARPFAPWLYRIVINRCLDTLRGRGRLESGKAADAALRNETDGNADPAAAAVRTETREVVRAAVGMLPPTLRAVVVLKYFLDLSEREIAEVVGCPLGTVKWRLFVGRRRVGRSLSGRIEREPDRQLGRRSV